MTEKSFGSVEFRMKLKFLNVDLLKERKKTWMKTNKKKSRKAGTTNSLKTQCSGIQLEPLMGIRIHKSRRLLNMDLSICKDCYELTIRLRRTKQH